MPGVVRTYQDWQGFSGVAGSRKGLPGVNSICQGLSGVSRMNQGCQELECVGKNAKVSLKSLLGLSWLVTYTYYQKLLLGSNFSNRYGSLIFPINI